MKKLITLFVTLSTLTSFAAAPSDGGIDYEGNLALIPATDPEVSNAPAIPADMQGVHPRLLFTEKEIAKLKANIASDDLLKMAAEDVISYSKGNVPPPEGSPAKICKSDTPALVTSFERYVKLAYAYALTDGDPTVKDNLVGVLQGMLDQPYWGDTKELDSSMGAANNMFMVGVLFDTVYDDLDPEFRTKMAEKILTHVRRLHWLGHKQLVKGVVKYWQQDPQPNHRWHRNAGMTACLLAIADMPEMKGRTDYLMKELKEEVEFILKWYPKDGDCHEGASYQRFGYVYLALTADMWDRAVGTDYRSHPGLSNAWKQQVYYWAPGRMGDMSFGDDPNYDRALSARDMAFFFGPKISRDKTAQAAYKNYFHNNSTNKYGRVNLSWTLLATYDPTVGEGDYTQLPTYHLFADLGAATMRDHWGPDAVLFSFKCGPYGGYGLNEYRHTVLADDGRPHYVNLAHDDPDANSFALGTQGEFLFHPGRYAQTKLTDNHSTILVDGKGQRLEGDQYTQPDYDNDMREFSYLTGWKVDKKTNRIIVEGEAGNAYPALDTFRRSCIWMPGEYILILDNVRTTNGATHKISWQAVTEKAQFDDPEKGLCHIETANGNRMDMQMLSSQDIDAAIDYKQLVGRWGSELINQFKFFQKTDAIKYACLMDAWKKGVRMTFSEADGIATVKVTGEGINDTWTWKTSPDLTTPSQISGTRDDAQLIELTTADKAPHGD
jgi:hypothetical protein